MPVHDSHEQASVHEQLLFKDIVYREQGREVVGAEPQEPDQIQEATEANLE